MVGVTGLEPVTPSMSRKYSNQLSYTPTDINGLPRHSPYAVSSIDHGAYGPMHGRLRDPHLFIGQNPIP